jgi:hypothetical protein
MTAEEYAETLGLDLSRTRDVVDLAMTIEAQAMDLYSRAAESAGGQAREVLGKLAGEETEHLRFLGTMMDRLTASAKGHRDSQGPSGENGKTLVLAGAGHAHMTILSRVREIVDQGIRVVVIGPSEHHYYSGMGPGVLGGSYTPEEIRFPVRRMVEDGGGTFLMDKVVRVDPSGKSLSLQSGATVSYDVASFNTGSFVPSPPHSSEGLPVKPIENLAAGREEILRLGSERTVRIGVVGGGLPASRWPGTHGPRPRETANGGQVRLFAGRQLLPRAPERVRRLCRRELLRREVDIVEALRPVRRGGRSHPRGRPPVRGGHRLLRARRQAIDPVPRFGAAHRALTAGCW